MFDLKLFVTGNSPTSKNAIENLTRVANHALRRGFRLEVIDILRQPHEACAEGVFCTPMLVKKSPGPEAWILGELSDEARLLRALLPEGSDDAQPAVVGASQPRVLLHPRRIVVIDDFEGIHDSFRVALDGAYVDVISARTGELGAEAVHACNPDLVYLDLKMPGKDGVATLRDIRQKNEHTPVIVMTAFADEYMNDLRCANREGLAFELLSKPLDIDELHLVSAVATGGFGPCLAEAGAAPHGSAVA